MAGAEQYYKIKLASGRILGPLGLDRIRLLILKRQITGEEIGRAHPVGDWQEISRFPAIAELFLAYAEGKLTAEGVSGSLRPANGDPNATRVLTSPSVPSSQTATAPENEIEEATQVFGEASEVTEKTQVRLPIRDATRVLDSSEFGTGSRSVLELDMDPEREQYPIPSRFAQEATQMLQPKEAQELAELPKKTGKKKTKKKGTRSLRETVTTLAAFFAVAILGAQFYLDDVKDQKAVVKFVPIRPVIPDFGKVKTDPDRSNKLYQEAIAPYLLDHVNGYKASVRKLLEAAAYDRDNVKALALLASSYLNLIDSSNKDEKYFFVISQLIEMSRAKKLDLMETVIADVEFYITVNKAEAAQSRIVDYIKVNSKSDIVVYYYLGLSAYHRGDFNGAVRYLSQIPDNNVFSAKVFYLRGMTAEKLNDNESALREYEKAIRMNPAHVKSRLRIADLQARLDRFPDTAPHLKYLIENPTLLAPKDLALAYYRHAQLSELFKEPQVALNDMERAVQLDSDNHDYLLQLYSLRSKAGERDPKIKAEARMYFFLGEGEKQLKDGKYQEALAQFLQARQQNLKSPIPLVKIGDMFQRMNDLGNARINYKLAAERAPNNIAVWSKYIDVLIQSFDWEEATKAMDKFRNLPVPQSAIDKAAADLYAKQGMHLEAQTLYQKAMSRDVIDSGVYGAYARSLLATRQYQQAAFFFALALRFDPLNFDVLVGIAKCIAGTESIDRAINMLEDELQKGNGARAELFAAIADFQIQKGAWALAQQSVDLARSANPDYPYTYKLQALIDLNNEGIQKDALDRALAAYQSYSDRNASDPSGYLERYRIFAKRGEFDKASSELDRVFAIYPKYPNLHYFKGSLYGLQGNRKVAIEEFKVELQNNPNSVPSLIALGKQLTLAGDANGALVYLNKAMQIAPRNPEAKAEAANANHALRNYQGAVALYQGALTYDKANPTLYKRLGLVYRDMGDGPNAALMFRKYLEMEPDAADKAEFERYL